MGVPGLTAARGLSLVQVRGFLLVAGLGFPLRWLLVAEHRLQSSGSAAVAPALAPRSAGSSCTWHRARVPCIDRRTLNYWATREVHNSIVKTL